MKTVCIIGVGNIGSRHLQALKKVKFLLSIEVVDTSTRSLKIAQERYEQIQSDMKHQVKFLKEIDKVSKNIDVAIIATNSDVRRDIIQQLLTASSVKYFILEKLLFQKRDDYYAIERLFKKYKYRAWVNCSMRTTPFYFKMKKDVNNQKIQYSVSGSQFGLITNAIHYIDHIAYLTGCDDFVIDTNFLDPNPIESKRKGFLELNGTLNAHFKDGSFGIFTCYSKGSAPLVIEILSENFRCISRETKKTAWISRENEWEWEEINTNLLDQSEMTNLVVEDIFNMGKCDLTLYDQSAKIHIQLLESLRKFLNQYSTKRWGGYPFT